MTNIWLSSKLRFQYFCLPLAFCPVPGSTTLNTSTSILASDKALSQALCCMDKVSLGPFTSESFANCRSGFHKSKSGMPPVQNTLCHFCFTNSTLSCSSLPPWGYQRRLDTQESNSTKQDCRKCCGYDLCKTLLCIKKSYTTSHLQGDVGAEMLQRKLDKRRLWGRLLHSEYFGFTKEDWYLASQSGLLQADCRQQPSQDLQYTQLSLLADVHLHNAAHLKDKESGHAEVAFYSSKL